MIATVQIRCALAVLVLVIGAAATWAALPPRGADDLKSTATDIVVGEVKAVYTTEAETSKGFVDTKYVIEISVTAGEKGESKPASLVYARAWTPSKRPEHWAGPQGQNHIPKAGDTVRLFLTRAKDGGLDVLAPNGVADAK